MWEGRTIIKEKLRYRYLKDKCMVMVNVKKTSLLFKFGFNPGKFNSGKFRFSPKPEMESVLDCSASEGLPENPSHLGVGKPLLSTAFKEV